MNSDKILLNEIYHGSINAITAISSYLDKIRDTDMFNILFEEMTDYRKIANKALFLLDALGEKAAASAKSEQVSLSAVKQIISLGASEQYIRGLLIRGSIEEIRDMISHINTCTDAKKEIRALAYSLIELEEQNIRHLR